MRAGRLRHRVTIQTVGSTYDDYGDLSDSWSTLASVWASISPFASKEQDIAAELSGVATHIVKIRYRSGINPKNRVLFGSRILQILGIKDWNEYKAGRCLELICMEVTT